uniref:Calpain 8 n=1 Tax=Varanus komodoensis TaxID=61221 RepID=A0A8D2LJY9_VARKO
RKCLLAPPSYCLSKEALEGLGSNRNAVKYLKQDFEALRKQCLQSGTLFKDEEFPACPSALGYNVLGPYSPQTQGIIWKRPTDLVANPQFIEGGATRTDIRQGALGDCWLLAAIASLTLDQEILNRIVPKDQSFQKDYAGIFHFQFWQYGEWVDVVVDDRLPTRNGQLLFLHSEERNEFWNALLEKAYAKLNGSYEALIGGSTVEGFEDFTGGIAEAYDLKKAPPDLYKIIQKALGAGSLLGCSIDITSSAETEAITSKKLVKGHAYSITGAEEVNYRGRPEKLLRIRNPWGEVEWTGAWSDKYVHGLFPDSLNSLACCYGGRMSFSDFQRQFTRLEICNLTPDTLSSDHIHKWDMTLLNGKWQRGSTAGGCQNYPATYWTNPQFKICLNEPDDDHEGAASEPCCTLLVGLMQKNRRRQKKMGEGLLSIGYSLYQLGNQTDVHLSREFFLTNRPVARSDTYVNLREVSNRLHLPQGEYLIVPSTFEPFKDGEFCLRIFSEKQAKTQYVSSTRMCNVGTYVLTFLLELDLNTFQNHGTGTLGLVEFKILWMKIQRYLVNPHISQVNGIKLCSGKGHAVSHPFTNFWICFLIGFTLSNKVQHSIAIRYACSNLTIDFDGFVACMIRLETLFSKTDLHGKARWPKVPINISPRRVSSVQKVHFFSTCAAVMNSWGSLSFAQVSAEGALCMCAM